MAEFLITDITDKAIKKKKSPCDQFTVLRSQDLKDELEERDYLSVLHPLQDATFLNDAQNYKLFHSFT